MFKLELFINVYSLTEDVRLFMTMIFNTKHLRSTEDVKANCINHPLLLSRIQNVPFNKETWFILSAVSIRSCAPGIRHGLLCSRSSFCLQLNAVHKSFFARLSYLCCECCYKKQYLGR